MDPLEIYRYKNCIVKTVEDYKEVWDSLPNCEDYYNIQEEIEAFSEIFDLETYDDVISTGFELYEKVKEWEKKNRGKTFRTLREAEDGLETFLYKKLNSGKCDPVGAMITKCCLHDPKRQGGYYQCLKKEIQINSDITERQ